MTGGTAGAGFHLMRVGITTPVTSACGWTKNGWAAGGFSLSSFRYGFFCSSGVTASG